MNKYKNFWVPSIFAGILIALGASLLLVVKSDGGLSWGLSQILGGLGFSVGLFMVMMTGSRLFTGQVINLYIQYSENKNQESKKEIITLGLLYFFGNLIGAIVFALVLYCCNITNLNEAAISITEAKCGMDIVPMFVRAILCNLLVCLAVWMGTFVRGDKSSISIFDTLICCLIPVLTFVSLGFEHVIANLFFLPYGLMVGANVSWVSVVGNIIVVLIGNIIGGIICGSFFMQSPQRKN